MRFFISLCLFVLVSTPAAAQIVSLKQVFDAADAKQWDLAVSGARRGSNPLLVDYIDWRRLRPIEIRYPAEEYLAFLEQHPKWPDRKRIFSRATEAMLLQGYSRQSATRWQQAARQVHKNYTPLSADAESDLLRNGFRFGVFDRFEMQTILSLYQSQLSAQDYRTRVDERLWDEDIAGAKLIAPMLTADEQRLVNARIALMGNQFGTDSAINSVPAALRSDPGLQFERLRYRARKQQDSGVEEILLAAPGTVPHPEKWWRFRKLYARNAIEDGDYQKAARLLQNHGQTDGADLADALWLRGWLNFQFLNNPKAAYQDFQDLHRHASFPVSLSRGAYWAGLAAEASGETAVAQNWFRTAAQHPSTFYGQLALQRLPGSALIPVAIVPQAKSQFPADEQRMIDTIRLLAQNRQDVSVQMFLTALAEQQMDPGRFLWLGELARSLGYPHYAVRLGKQAAQEKHLYIPALSHPQRAVPTNVIEPALALAITRQESEFNPRAQSSANAMGMMQLLPGTASSVARKNGLPYSQSSLFEPSYNMQLGSFFLRSLLNKYNGSYILAAAAYNAGPGNVDKWRARFGEPGTGQAALRWMELIPYTETRNYVQRVIENVQVYRALLGTQQPLTPERMWTEPR